LRYIGRKFATAFPWIATGAAGAGLAYAGLLAPLVTALGGAANAIAALGTEAMVGGAVAGTYAAPSLIQSIKDLFAADENSIQAGIKRWVEKYVGDDNDVQEFLLTHAKAAYEGKPGFRWRAKEWPVKLSKDQAEAFLEKNDKMWLDMEKQKVIDAEKAKADKEKADKGVAEELDENLHKWFQEKWVRFGPDGKIRGDCARGDDSEGKPKCLPQSKAHSLGKKGRASAAARKRREDPNPERSGKAINVNTKKKTNEAELDEACWKGYHKEGNKKMFGKTYPNCVKNTNEEQEHKCPHCGGEMVSEELMNEKKDACYYKVKSRYKVWPSAYASGALVKCRKKGASNWGNGGKSNESVAEDQLDEKWSQKYKDSINCSNPKGFSQKAHCAGKQKNESAIMSGLNQLDEGWKEKLGAAALAGSMALGAGSAHSRVTPDGEGGFTGGLKPAPTVTAPSDNKPAAEAPSGFSKEYLQKAADPNRTGRYMISVEKAQELLKNMP